MKLRLLKYSLALCIWLQGCGDEHVFLPQIEPAPGDNVKVKFIHAASDTVGVNLFFNDLKVTGATPSTITTFGSVNVGKVNVGTVTFQNAFPVTYYTGVNQTSGTFKVVFPESYNATTTFAEKTMSTTSSGNLSPSSYYTVAFVGVSPSYETVVYQDDLAQTPIDGKAYVRFANFIINSVDNVTLRATPPATTDDPTPAPVILFQNVAYKEMTNFVALPRTGTYSNIQILNAKTGAVIATLPAATSAVADNKVYTIFARGRIGVIGTAAPGLSRVINR